MSLANGAVLRRATTEDFSLIRCLEDDIFPEDPWTDGMIAEELASTARVYFIAEEPTDADSVEGGIASTSLPLGYGGVSLGPDADIMTIGVSMSARGRGVGSALMEALKFAAMSAGAERIFLEVRESNVAAQKLYEKHGFDRIGRIRRYFRNPLEDALTMVCECSARTSVH